jgi:hypothetical protein
MKRPVVVALTHIFTRGQIRMLRRVRNRRLSSRRFWGFPHTASSLAWKSPRQRTLWSDYRSAIHGCQGRYRPRPPPAIISFWWNNQTTLSPVKGRRTHAADHMMLDQPHKHRSLYVGASKLRVWPTTEGHNMPCCFLARLIGFKAYRRIFSKIVFCLGHRSDPIPRWFNCAFLKRLIPIDAVNDRHDKARSPQKQRATTPEALVPILFPCRTNSGWGM